MNKVCPRCGGNYDPNMTFCSDCGMSLITERCSVCGKSYYSDELKVKNNILLCSNCIEDLDNKEDTNVKENSISIKTYFRWFIGVSILVSIRYFWGSDIRQFLSSISKLIFGIDD